MYKSNKFYFRERLSSFRHAFNGIKALFRTEHNAWIHAACMIAVIVAGITFHIANSEWIIIFLVIGLVFICEMINTALEKLCNIIQIEFHPEIKMIKDIGAASVLLASIVALIAGVIIFLPRIINT